jgi:PhzF family phenazine biosynthesis protein
MSLTITQVDAFTHKPFAGNPAAVCVLPESGDAAWMQQVAQEMALPATAFLHPQPTGFNLRWFSPAAELTLCGHGTLASAHVLWEMGYLSLDQIAHFDTLSGPLQAKRQGDWIELDLPAEPEQPVAVPPSLAEALGVNPRYVGKNRLDYLVEVASEAIVRSLKPHLNLLLTIPTRGVIVTSRADSGTYDCVSRFFAPGIGINEDPATGSAHCCLGPFWGARLNKTKIIAYQASPRGGVIHIHLNGPRVYLSGQAVTVLQGKLVL